MARWIGLWLACFGGASALGCAGEELSRPNLVLISVDTLAADQLACFGGPGDSGQSVCRLAEQGTLFAWTMTPGRGIASSAASVLTGLTEAGHGVDDTGLSFLRDARETLAERLARVGYATAAFVASPRLNRTRRLDQGFDHYDDRFASNLDLPTRVQKWIARSSTAYFVWIHLRGEAGLSDIDRLVARLDGVLQDDARQAGVLFAALRGTDPSQTGIGLSSHRVPMIWRAPATFRSGAPSQVSLALASLLDITPTLTASAGIPGPESGDRPALGHPLDRALGSVEDRFLLLRDSARNGEVGLASGPYLYVRKRSALDTTGRPVPSSALTAQAPRFLTLVSGGAATAGSAGLAHMPWRKDVLSTDSPVPRLEFHLARRLREEAESALE
ncbi:MAG: sulfatase-like hydrolase/transferase [Myxococcota bacterium]